MDIGHSQVDHGKASRLARQRCECFGSRFTSQHIESGLRCETPDYPPNRLFIVDKEQKRSR
jgi:hypothetical protein